jgi:hypothetical protein
MEAYPGLIPKPGDSRFKKTLDRRIFSQEVQMPAKKYDIKEYDIKGMSKKIKALRDTATELKGMSSGMQAVDRNVDRIMANVRALEIDISEVDRILDGKDLV